MGDAAGTVTGITGGSVIINCVYSHENVKTRENAKSFCKMLDSECTTVTEVKNDLWIPEERFSMIDNKSLGLVNVLIRNLTVNDSGTYRCKADSTWFQEVKFNVEQDLYIIILVVMCLILLLAGGLTLLLLNQRCKKMHGSGSSHQGNMREGDDEGVSSPHYEAVSDSGNTPLRPSAQKPISLNTVYDTACLPTNPSDSDFYILAEQP
ncbi:polymeric immunoglobulin receptor-like isoform X1 [Labeo rohita]|nr:polymeric immunoglobulin receptor-like isoform X1 [Labeo rohita]